MYRLPVLFFCSITAVLSSWACVTTADETNPLNVEVFVSSEEHMGLGVASAIIYGERDAVLIDAQFTLSNAHRLVAEIIETGRRLTTIYITHVHPDHFMGLPVIKQAFPQARVVAISAIADDVNNSADFKLEYWGNKILGHNGANTKVAVETLDEPIIMLEGRRLEIIGPFHADAPNSTAVWIPSIKTLVASDAIYDHAHAWLAATKTPEMMTEWLSVLDRFDALKPEVVVPGHAPSNEFLSPASIDFTRRYIETFIAKMREAPDGESLRTEMKRIYPDAAMPFCLEYSSKILKERWTWEGQWPASLRDMPVTY